MMRRGRKIVEAGKAEKTSVPSCMQVCNKVQLHALTIYIIHNSEFATAPEFIGLRNAGSL